MNNTWIDWHLYGVFMLAQITIAISPGPAVILITTQGLRRGPKAAIRGSLGILTVNAFYFLLAAFGIGVFINRFKGYFNYMILAGACYLIWLGLKLWIDAKPSKNSTSKEIMLKEKNEWKEAVFTQLSNPKAILYFTALLPQFVDPQKPVMPQILILGVSSVMSEFPILFTYGYLGHLGSQKFGGSRFNFWVDRTSACLLMMVALLMTKQVSANL